VVGVCLILFVMPGFFLCVGGIMRFLVFCVGGFVLRDFSVFVSLGVEFCLLCGFRGVGVLGFTGFWVFSVSLRFASCDFVVLSLGICVGCRISFVVGIVVIVVF